MPFQKGESGNPAGRPRGARNQATVLVQDLLAAVAAGDLTPSQGADLAAVIDVYVRALVATSFEERLAKLEPTMAAPAHASIALPIGGCGKRLPAPLHCFGLLFTTKGATPAC